MEILTHWLELGVMSKICSQLSRTPLLYALSRWPFLSCMHRAALVNDDLVVRKLVVSTVMVLVYSWTARVSDHSK